LIVLPKALQISLAPAAALFRLERPVGAFRVLKVVLVEDDCDIREVLTLALRLDREIDVISYASGEEALDDIKVRRILFDVALLDYRLSGMTGIELHQELRELPWLSQLVTVIITANVGREYIALFEGHGVAGLITKPFNVFEVAREVRALTQPHRPGNVAIRWLHDQVRKFM